MKVLVTGATGFVGSRLVPRLAARGTAPGVLCRDPDRARSTLGDVTPFSWDAVAGPPPAEAFDGVDAIVHLAGEPIAGRRWNTAYKECLWDSRILGTRHLVAGLRKCAAPPPVLVSASAIGFYGSRGDELLPETASRGTGYLADMCVAWEEEALAAAELGVRVVVVRIGIVLERHGGALKEMLLPFRLGLGGRLSSGHQYFPWIHLDDLVVMLLHATESPDAHGIWNGTAPNPVTNREFTRALAASLHRPAFLPVPSLALRLLMGEIAPHMLASARVVPEAPLAAGFQFQHPDVRPALEAILQE